MTIRIEAHLEDYDPDPGHSTDAPPGFLHQVIFVDCTECTDLPKQVPTLEAARAWAVGHAAGHYAQARLAQVRAADHATGRLSGEARCNGCGCFVELEHLDADGFGPDCRVQDEGSQCG